MKKIIAIILLIISVGGLIITFTANLRTEYCCACNLDNWRAGFGFKALIGKNLRCQCLANAGCAAGYKLFPIDFLILSLGFGAAGIVLINQRNKKIN